MLTLAEAARRDALEVASLDDLTRWRADIKARCLAMIESDYAKRPFADISDIEMKFIDGPLEDGLADATYNLIRELSE